MPTETMSQSAFARLHSVSRKTIGEWKTRGYLRMSGSEVLVEESNAKLSAAGRSRLTPVTLKPRTKRRLAKTVTQSDALGATHGVAEVTGDVARSADDGGHYRQHPEAGFAAVVIDTSVDRMLEVFRDRIPFDELRPMVEAVIAKMRASTVECLDEPEDDGGPPRGLASWGEHPWFSRAPLTEEEWEEVRVAGPVLD